MNAVRILAPWAGRRCWSRVKQRTPDSSRHLCEAGQVPGSGERAAVVHTLELPALGAGAGPRRLEGYPEGAADALVKAAFCPAAEVADVLELLGEAVRARFAQERLAHLDLDLGFVQRAAAGDDDAVVGRQLG